METALFTEAEANFRKSLEIEPNYFDANFNLGRLYFDEEQYERADVYLSRAVRINATDADALKYLVMNRVKLGKAEGALSILKDAIKASPEDPQLYVSLGNIYRSTGKYGEALDAFKQAIDLNENEADAYLGIGDTYIKKGDRKKAEEAYRKASEIDPTSYLSYLNLAAMYREDGRTDDAIEALKKVIQIKPDLHEVYVDIAELILSEDGGETKDRAKKLNEALTLVSTSLKAYSDYSRGYEVRGKILAALGKKDEAIVELKKALKYDAENSKAREFLATLSPKDATGDVKPSGDTATDHPSSGDDGDGIDNPTEKGGESPVSPPAITDKKE
jgi:superkiller protein 3